MINIRNYRSADKQAVEQMLQRCFNNLYEPGCNEHLISANLRKSSSLVKSLDLVMECNGEIIGSIMFSKAVIRNHNEVIDTLAVGPFCIDNEFQGKGYGKQLMDYGLSRAKQEGFKVVLLYGFPEIYSKFGFSQAALYNIGADENLFPSALHLIELEPDFLKPIGGIFEEEFNFETDEEELHNFNKGFPDLPKLELECQQAFFEMLESTVNENLIGSKFE